MSESLNIKIKKQVWDYYVKLPNFEAQCRFCEKKYVYISYTHFKTHVAKHHTEIWKYEEERKLIKWPWQYFKYFNKLYSQCIICDSNVLSKIESAKNHLSLHTLQQQKNNIYQNWLWKYWTTRDDFAVECNICCKSLTFSIYCSLKRHTRKTHPDKLKDMQKAHDTVDSLKRILLLETDKSSMSQTIATKEYLWDHYIKLPDFKAQCKFCENILCYISDTNFCLHIAKNHHKIWKYENERKQIKWPWRYFKYFDNVYLQCIICDVTVHSTTEFVENHLTLHSLQQLENNIYQNWPRKYYTQKDDFVVECNICCKSVALSIPYSLKLHTRKTHPDKLKDMQKTHNTAGSAKRISSLKPDTTFISQIIVTKERLWNYYIKLPELKAQCKFCKKKYIYVQISNFQRHIVRYHTEIYKFEKERKLIKWPWMHFKYLDNTYSQCIICDANVLLAPEAVENYLSLHSLQQLENNIYQDWSLKYCTQKDDFEVECNTCCKSVALSIPFSLKLHTRKTHPDKLKDMQETHNTAGSSKRVLLLKTETTFKLILSLKDCYVLLKKSLHCDLYM